MASQTHTHDGTNSGFDEDVHTPLLKNAKRTTVSWAGRLSQSFLDWFSWELTSAVTALVSFVVIIVILIAFDNSALPDWPSIFTINSIVALFTSFASLSMMSVVGACISQSKWLWYRQHPRPLGHIQLFDEASRGPWGAAFLMFVFKYNTLASLGSVVVTLSLLFGPFIQQSLTYNDMLVDSGDRDASIVRAQNYRAPSTEGLPLPSVVDLSMKAAVYNGVFDASNQANSGTEHHCSTGNCTFDSFASLAVGSKCVNITDKIEKEYDATTECYKLSLPNGPSVSGLGNQINTSTTKISPSLHDYEASVVQFSALFAKADNDSYDARAWECALYYCVNQYSALVNDGDFFQSVQKTWRNNSASLSQNGALIYRPPPSSINITANSSEFTVDHLAATALNSFLTTAFTGSGAIDDPEAGSYFSSDVIHAFLETDDLPTRIDNLAISMSNNIRQQNNSGSQPFQGRAMKGQTHLKVRWAWLAYPTVLLAIMTVYLACVMRQTRKGQILVWKSSTLALLFHGNQLQLGGCDDMPADTLSAMAKKASEMNIGLSRADDGKWRLTQN